MFLSSFIKEEKVAVYKLNEITKTLDKLFKYNVKTTEKVANLKWQDLDSIGDFLPFEKSLIMDLKIIVESNYKTNRRRKIEKGIIEFLAGNQGEEEK